MDKKYSLYKTLLRDKNEILSHVFMNCANKFFKEMADANKGLTDEEIQAREIDIELKIDGHTCDPKLFFDQLYEQYKKQVELKAEELVKERTSGKLTEIQDKIQETKEVLDDWADGIDWQTDNLFKTK